MIWMRQSVCQHLSTFVVVDDSNSPDKVTSMLTIKIELVNILSEPKLVAMIEEDNSMLFHLLHRNCDCTRNYHQCAKRAQQVEFFLKNKNIPNNQAYNAHVLH